MKKILLTSLVVAGLFSGNVMAGEYDSKRSINPTLQQVSK